MWKQTNKKTSRFRMKDFKYSKHFPQAEALNWASVRTSSDWRSYFDNTSKKKYPGN